MTVHHNGSFFNRNVHTRESGHKDILVLAHV